MASVRPPQPPTPDPDAFTVHRAIVRHGLSTAFVDEGEGYPLVLLHGYPETKRIWWRNIEALAACGYQVVVPDLRGHGDSDVDHQDRYDIVEYSRDVHALMSDHLGHDHYGVVAGDVGAAVAYDMSLRFAGVSATHGLVQHRPAAAPRRVRRPPASTCPIGPSAIPSAARRRTTSTARATSRTSWRPSSTRPSGGGATSPTSTAIACGRRRAPSPRPTSTFMTEPWADEDAAAGRVGRLPDDDGAANVVGGAPAARDQPDAHAWCSTGPTTTSSPSVRRVLRGGLHRSGRTARRPPGRPLPPVGASRRPQPARRGWFSDLRP